MLFIPGNRLQWLAKASATGADAVVVDLEDAVPGPEKSTARETLAKVLDGPDRPGVPVIVRVNALGTDLFLRDIEALAGLGIVGVMVPKVESVADIAVVDRILSWFESRAHPPLCVVPVLETAWAIRHAYEIAAASDRVAYMGGLSSKGGDVERAMGYRWSAEGGETLAMRSLALLDARAAGVWNPLTGLWSDVDDLDGLRKFAVASRNLGYEGLTVIHPSHVPVVNEVFTPTSDELEHDLALVRAMEIAARQGQGAVRFHGHMIDEAMAATSRERLDRYKPSWRS
ncbi:HpcH/HpaI aldolase/citrate lyase family protein [Dietzia maris]|nr:CoA ester lyase [Dietzia sp. DQ11-71]